MGLFIRQNENRSQLQERLAAELREKARQQMDGGEPLDQASKSNYIKNTEQTSSQTLIGIAVAVVSLVIVVAFFLTR